MGERGEAGTKVAVVFENWCGVKKFKLIRLIFEKMVKFAKIQLNCV
jgi:hypothetical protein